MQKLLWGQRDSLYFSACTVVKKYKPSLYQGLSTIKRGYFLIIKFNHITRILLLAASLLLAQASAADTLLGRVVGVADGDTVTSPVETLDYWFVVFIARIIER